MTDWDIYASVFVSSGAIQLVPWGFGFSVFEFTSFVRNQVPRKNLEHIFTVMFVWCTQFAYHKCTNKEFYDILIENLRIVAHIAVALIAFH